MTRLFSARVLLCAFLISPAFAQNFLDGVVSINVTMTHESMRAALLDHCGHGQLDQLQ